MKKLITLIAIFALAGVAFAGQLVDAGMDGSVQAQTVENYQVVADGGGWVTQETTSDWGISGGVMTATTVAFSGFGQIIAGAGFTDGMTFTYDMAYTGLVGNKYNIRVVGVMDAGGDFTDNLTGLNAPIITGADSYDILYISGTIALTGTQAMTDMGDFTVDAAGYDYIVVTMIAKDIAGGGSLSFDNVDILGGCPLAIIGTLFTIK